MLPSPAPKLKQRGFSLIEVAIVLGIIGLVIGGIWVAAATVAENRRINQFNTGFITFLRFFKDTYQDRDTRFLPAFIYMKAFLQILSQCRTVGAGLAQPSETPGG